MYSVVGGISFSTEVGLLALLLGIKTIHGLSLNIPSMTQVKGYARTFQDTADAFQLYLSDE